MALRDELFLSGVWTESLNRYVNSSGTLLTSVVGTDRAGLIADTYTLVLSAVAGSSATVTISTGSPNNPWNGRVVAGVTISVAAPLDTTTLPGLGLEYNNTPANGWTSTITVGEQKGTFQAGGASAGVASTGVRHRVTNTGADELLQCKARVLTQAIYLPISGTGPFNYMEGFADGAVEKTDPDTGQLLPYVLTLSGVTGAGASKTANLSVDGTLMPAASILDLNTMLEVSGTGLKATDPSTPQKYRVIDGDLLGLVFSIHESCANANEANLVVVPNRHLQIAPDSAGTEGEYDTADVDLTTAGETVAGTIPAAGVAYYWTRVEVADGSSGKANPYLCNVALVGNNSSPEPAGWLS